MPTVIGVIFFLCALFCFLYREDALFGLLIVATVFEAASAINIAERGIQSYYIVALFIIARAAVNRMVGRRVVPRVPYGGWLRAFGIVCFASALFLPGIFEGLPIYDPQVGIDDGLLIHPPLVYKLSNLVQPAYLVIHIATAFSLLALRFSFRKTNFALLCAFYIEVAFLVTESLFQFMGVAFPLEIVLNNPGYSLWNVAAEANGIRNPGTFAEPSLAGAFMLVFCVSFMVSYFRGRGTALKPLLAFLAVGLAASSSTLFLATATFLILLVRFAPVRPPFRVDLQLLKRSVWIVLPVALITLLPTLLFASFRNALLDLTVGKGETSSFFNRTASDIFGLQLFAQTFGFGVGLGSNRASSLLTTLLSNTGIAGTVSFFVFYCRLYARLPKLYSWLKWAGFALLLNMCMGLADVTMPLFWIPILLAIQLTVYGKSVEEIFSQQSSSFAYKPLVNSRARLSA